MAEESSKGVALVILGIVAIIAIVGLVLLFTGARKAAVGEFAVPAAKEYGGAIEGVMDPYSRAFSGRAREYPSGNVEHFSAQWQGSAGVMPGGESYGGTAEPRGEQYDYRKTYERALTEIPSMQTTCTPLAELAEMPQFSEPASAQKARGRVCKHVSELTSVAIQVAAGSYGREREVYEAADSIGVDYCCIPSTLQGTN